MNIEIQYKGYEFKLLIDNLPHIVIKDRIIGFQAFNSENRMFEIEFYTKDKNITVQYDTFDKWQKILKELNKVL